jgi:hypothetical protein
MKTISKFTQMKTIFTFIFIAVSCFSFSQGKDADTSRRDKIEQLKIAYITKELALTSAEAEKFWPLYNELESKTTQLRKVNKKTGQELKAKAETLKDDEIKRKMNLIFENESQIGLLKKEYYDKIGAVIGFKKTAKLIHVEQQFKRELLKRVNGEGRGSKGQGLNNGPRPGAGQRQR